MLKLDSSFDRRYLSDLFWAWVFFGLYLVLGDLVGSLLILLLDVLLTTLPAGSGLCAFGPYDCPFEALEIMLSRDTFVGPCACH